MKDMTAEGFAARLATGLTNEERIGKYATLAAGWWTARFPSKKPNERPSALTPDGEIVIADYMMCKEGRSCWGEAKSKTRSNWFYSKGEWQTGMDLYYFRAYQEISKTSGLPMFVFFLHEDPNPSAQDLANGSPETAPTGLWVNTLEWLAKKENYDHMYDGYGRGGMIYWNVSRLKQLASLEKFREVIGEKAEGA
jgi:hypothetical protein